MRRGEVWWTEFDPSRGVEIQKTRPAVILSVDQVNRARGTVIVAPLSTAPRAYPPISVAVTSLGRPSIAICDQVRAVDKSRLTRRAGSLNGDDLKAIENGVRAVLGL
jgi:mRNA interferase MazF